METDTYLIQLELVTTSVTTREKIIWYLENLNRQYPDEIKQSRVLKSSKLLKEPT